MRRLLRLLRLWIVRVISFLFVLVLSRISTVLLFCVIILICLSTLYMVSLRLIISLNLLLILLSCSVRARFLLISRFFRRWIF